MRKLVRSAGDRNALQIVRPSNCIIYVSLTLRSQAVETFICEEAEKQLVILKGGLKWFRRK
jgi:hypothetical protein